MLFELMSSSALVMMVWSFGAEMRRIAGVPSLFRASIRSLLMPSFTLTFAGMMKPSGILRLPFAMLARRAALTPTRLSSVLAFSASNLLIFPPFVYCATGMEMRPRCS